MPPALKGWPPSLPRGSQGYVCSACRSKLSAAARRNLAGAAIIRQDAANFRSQRRGQASSTVRALHVQQPDRNVAVRTQLAQQILRPKSWKFEGLALARVPQYLAALTRGLIGCATSDIASQWAVQGTTQSRLIRRLRASSLDLSGGIEASSEFSWWCPDDSVANWQSLLSSTRTAELTRHLREELELLRAGRAGYKPLPLCVIQDLTARPSLSPMVLSLLLDYIRLLGDNDHLHHDPKQEFLAAGQDQNARLLLLSERMVAIIEIFSNLAYHARCIWPELRPQVAMLATSYLVALTKDSMPLSIVARPAISFCANALLHILAFPAELDRFKHLETQEAAQTTVLRFMAQFSPPLELDQYGFRAIAMTQLMLPKTASERTWAKLKALSWPPWKEDKTGMDASIGPEYGISRACRTLEQMRAAGYSDTAWTKVARLYAGWDTDNSPTIQYRFFLPPFPPHEEEMQTWMARIRTTRTLREAWGAFLAYKDSGAKIYHAVYAVMLEKIILEIIRTKPADRRGDSDNDGPDEDLVPARQEVLPGDTRQVWPPPPSVHLEMYTRTEPPDLESFLAMMLRDGARVQSRALSQLLELAPDHRTGELLITNSRLSDGESSAAHEEKRASDKAIMRFAMRHPFTQALPLHCDSKITVSGWTLSASHYAQAMSMLRGDDRDAELAASMLAALAANRGFSPLVPAGDAKSVSAGLVDAREEGTEAAELKPQLDRMVAWSIATELLERRVLGQSSPKATTLRHLMQLAHSSTTAAKVAKRHLTVSAKLLALADRVLKDVPTQIARLLTCLITPGHKHTPRLYYTPDSRTLLLAAQALASVGATDQSLALARFMRQYWNEISSQLSTERAGRRNITDTLTVLTSALSPQSRDLRWLLKSHSKLR